MRCVSVELVRCTPVVICGTLWNRRNIYGRSSARPALRHRPYCQSILKMTPYAHSLDRHVGRSMKGKYMPAKSGLVLWIAVAAGLLSPEICRAQDRPIVLRATTLIDGKGGVMRNVNIVVQGQRIMRIDAGAQGTTDD